MKNITDLVENALCLIFKESNQNLLIAFVTSAFMFLDKQ